MMEKFNYWQEKTRQKEYWDHEANEQCILAKAHIAEIDHELTDMKKNRPNYYVACEKDCTECGVKLCCHKEGQDCKKTQCGNEDFGCHFPNLALEENNNPTDSNILEKEELVRKYMEKHNIYQISLDNDQLVIKYNSKKTQKLAVEGQELQTIKNFVEKQTNKSIIREQSLNSNQPEKPNYPL